MLSIKNENHAGNLPTGEGEAAHPGSSVRRTLVGSGLAGLAGLAASLFGGAPARAEGDHHGGPLSAATIGFGSWLLPLDRHPNFSPPPANHHGLCPDEVTIKCGGCVNFIIAGLHQILIYDDGTLPGDIDTTVRITPAGPPPPTQLLADPKRRIYRGLDPTVSPRERVEVVHFDRPGTYLVICAIPRHFADGMYGFIRVLR